MIEKYSAITRKALFYSSNRSTKFCHWRCYPNHLIRLISDYQEEKILCVIMSLTENKNIILFVLICREYTILLFGCLIFSPTAMHSYSFCTTFLLNSSYIGMPLSWNKNVNRIYQKYISIFGLKSYGPHLLQVFPYLKLVFARRPKAGIKINW